MQSVQKRQPKTYETDMSTNGYLGRNSWGNHSALKPNESSALINWDIFKGNSEEYVKSRRGSQFLLDESSTMRSTTNITNAITWDVGAEEYLITQDGTSFYSQALLTTGAPVLIAHAISGALTVSTSAQAEMFLSGDKIYVFHPGGNKIIRWTGSAFVGIEMGMTAPSILAVTSATAGVITGSYTMGVELVYRVSNVDVMASSPNRKTTGRILAVSGTIAAKQIKLTITSTVLDATPVNWTHLRVWRSKNKNSILTDPLNPIDPQGTDDVLYEEALITKAEMLVTSLTAIATGSTLPIGNAGVTAGKVSTVYTITLNNADSVFDFAPSLDLDRIELLPLPPAACGCFHAGHIFVSNITDSSLDDSSKNNIYYSLFAGTKYSTQYDPANFIDTSRDGQQMIKLLSFEKDLIGIKEAKTGRLPNGDVDLAYETMDYRIGVSNKNLARVIPGVGLVAVTNDYGDFRIFGYDLKWSSFVHGIDVSLPIRVESSAFTAANVSFGYVNGKLMISDGAGVVYVLHEKEQRGWTTYTFPITVTNASYPRIPRLFTFANGARAAFVSKNAYLVEIDASGLTTDAWMDIDADEEITTGTQLITLSEDTYRFQVDEGKANLEQLKLEVTAELSAPLVAIPYVNGLPWPLASSTTETKLVPDPAIFGSSTGLRDGDYTLYVEPATIGDFQWCRLRGNFIHYTLTTTAPAIMRTKKLSCIVDADRGFGQFDPFQKYAYANTVPDWASNAVWIFNFDDDSNTLYDQSGNGNDHSWVTGELYDMMRHGTRTFDSAMAPGSGNMTGPGMYNPVPASLGLSYGIFSGWVDTDFEDTEFIGDADGGTNSQSLAWGFIGSFPSLNSPVMLKGGGRNTDFTSESTTPEVFYLFIVNTDGSLEFRIKTSSLTYKYTTAAGVITAGSTVYNIQFLLTAGGATGAFYVASRTAALTVAKTTTRATLPFFPSTFAAADWDVKVGTTFTSSQVTLAGALAILAKSTLDCQYPGWVMYAKVVLTANPGNNSTYIGLATNAAGAVWDGAGDFLGGGLGRPPFGWYIDTGGNIRLRDGDLGNDTVSVSTISTGNILEVTLGQDSYSELNDEAHGLFYSFKLYESNGTTLIEEMSGNKTDFLAVGVEISGSSILPVAAGVFNNLIGVNTVVKAFHLATVPRCSQIGNSSTVKLTHASLYKGDRGAAGAQAFQNMFKDAS